MKRIRRLSTFIAPLVFLLVTGTLMAESRLKIATTAGPVTLMPYAPSLNVNIDRFLESNKDFGRLSPYAMVLTNNSGRAIHGLTVRWTLVDFAGKESVMDYATDSFFLTRTAVLESGDSLLVTPTIMLPASLLARGFTGPGAETANREADSFDKAAERQVSLDTIILDDGMVFGPDVSNTVKSIEARRHAAEMVLGATPDALSRMAATRPTDPQDQLGTWLFRLSDHVQRSGSLAVEQLKALPKVRLYRDKSVE